MFEKVLTKPEKTKISKFPEAHRRKQDEIGCPISLKFPKPKALR